MKKVDKRQKESYAEIATVTNEQPEKYTEKWKQKKDTLTDTIRHKGINGERNGDFSCEGIEKD